MLSDKYERDVAVWESNHIEDCKKIGLFKNKDVLEVGGVLPKSYIAKLNVKSWTCIDPAPYYDSFKENNYEVIKESINEYSFKGRLFDTIISTNSFEHISELEKALNNMYEILKPKGFLSALFGPIWSCNRGHHLWVRDNGKYITFNDNIIPDWAHLLYEENELKKILREKYNSQIIDEIIYQTYHTDFINRLFYEDYIQIINDSSFIIHELRNWHQPTFPPVEIRKILEEKYKGKENFHSFSLKVLLQK